MVVVAPMYEEDEKACGIYYNTAAVIDADGTYLGKYRKTHIPHVKGFWEKFYFRPGQPRLPGLRDGRRQDRRLHLLRPPLPRRRPGARAQRRRDRPDPERDLARPVRVPVADRAGQPRRRQRLLRRDHQPGRHRSRLSATTTSTARATSSTRAASSSATSAVAHDEELLVRDLDLDRIMEVRNTWQFYRDRRPDAYADLTRPSSRYHPSGSAVWRRTAEPPRFHGGGRHGPCSSASRSSPSTRPSARWR